MSKSLLLLGGVLPAVQLLRRAQDYVDKVHIIAQDDDAIVLSRYGEKFLYSQPQDCITVIRQWIKDQGGEIQQWLVVPCSEFFVQYIEEFRHHGFEVFAPASQVLSTFYNKKALYSWLDTLDVKVAEFKSLDYQLDFIDSKSYIIKSAKASDDYSAPFKTKLITQQDELDAIRQMIPQQYWDNFVIQRLYQHNQSISYGGVWVKGQEVASIIASQVRQYPQGITSCTVRATDIDDTNTIHDVIRKIASNVQLHGFIELEFIKNEAGLYPIDLNPRLWGWSNFLFYNFPAIPAVVLQNQSPDQIDNKHIESWSNIWRDVPARDRA
ncbi:MAG: hypothetical protein EOO89_21355, partial [Pedobacter sp.]